MTPILIPIHCLILFLIFVQSASLYKIYASNDDRSDLLRHSLPSRHNEKINQASRIKNPGYYDDEDGVSDSNDDENKYDFPSWLSSISERREQQESLLKRSVFPFIFRSSKSVQPRNNRPHWNPLVAAYKRCGELLTPEERESCFKDAIQMLFVHKLRK